ncbi:prolipoprotein diacylglyceryl transferase [Dysgonomonas massiliensis]|uniref:prolipoprotein diacylglyceryl transferase n=1 Tax=Dysgonomonas massiliensis TaxID=2040292 RepID=UPI000C78A9C4|nr:prolipoprotein diacylglyceryl transferase [Dysgonomonas massiliensis]
MLLSITWDVSPAIFEIFGREIRWYGLLWASALFLTAFIVQKMYKHENLPEKWFDSLFIYVATGLIIGARLGHCLFYDPVHYLSAPWEMLKIWEGGLSSHGGAIGMLIGITLYSKKVTKRSIIWALDRLIVGVGLGATSIRLGNLFNHEIYGGPTDMPWGFRFVENIHSWMQGAEPIYTVPSHPTQIYEALIYFLTFLLGMYMYWVKDLGKKQGLILGVSLICIFFSRFMIEFIKNLQEDFEVSMVADYGINMGQLLSIPFIIWGVWLVWNALKKGNTTLSTKK